MKQIFTILITVIILGVIAYKTNPKDVLIRKWKTSDISAPMINAEMKAAFLREANTIEFMKDGKYIPGLKEKKMIRELTFCRMT